MQSNKKVNETTGDCDCCMRTDVVLVLQHGDMMCDECVGREAALVVTTKSIEQIRKVDATIELKQDIFNSQTPFFGEIRAAIQNDVTIPESDREYRYAEVVAERIQAMSEVIFADEQALIAKRNVRFAWLVEIKQIASKLEVEKRSKFKQYDMNFEHKSPSSKSKSTSSGSSSKTTKGKMAEMNAAAAKYGVPVEGIRIMEMTHHKSIDECARMYRDMIGGN